MSDHRLDNIRDINFKVECQELVLNNLRLFRIKYEKNYAFEKLHDGTIPFFHTRAFGRSMLSIPLF